MCVVSAAALLPVVTSLVENFSRRIPEILKVLLTNLLDMKDELTASTASIMELLSKFFSYKKVLDEYIASKDEFALPSLKELVPRMFACFRHTLPSVRMSVLATLRIFVHLAKYDDWINLDVLRMTFQNMLVEERQNISNASFSLWLDLVEYLLNEAETRPGHVEIATLPAIEGWISLATSSFHRPLNTKLFFVPAGSDTEPDASDTTRYNLDGPMIKQDYTLVSSETVMRVRLVVCKALAYLLSAWSNDVVNEKLDASLTNCLTSNSAMRCLLAAVILEKWTRSNGHLLLLHHLIARRTLERTRSHLKSCRSPGSRRLSCCRCWCKRAQRTRFQDRWLESECLNLYWVA